ncbi:MAG: hypothetical protein M3463_04045 [Verrucomicrobiota bacterium]|nr:hypothetical protein [Verrucomicrobiota bacterium]
MKPRTLLWIVVAVLTLHAAGFFVVMRMQMVRKHAHVPPPNFGWREITYVDETTGEKTVVRELRVSTKLAPRATAEEALEK